VNGRIETLGIHPVLRLETEFSLSLRLSSPILHFQPIG
jgi:hypothetical protein